MKLARFLLVLFWCWPLTVSGQESAISGVWELHSEDGFGSVSLRLQTSADGSLSLKAAGRAGPELLDLVGDELAFLPDSLVAAVDGAGTWRADGDSLRISWSQLDIAVNGVPLTAFPRRPRRRSRGRPGMMIFSWRKRSSKRSGSR